MTSKQKQLGVWKRYRLVRYATYLIAALIAVALLIVVINVPDERLDPKAAAALHEVPSTLAVDENAEFAMYGTGVAKGQDPHEFGVRYVALNNQWMRAMDEGRQVNQDELQTMEQQKEALPWIGNARDLCGKSRTDCLRDYVRHRQQIEKLVRDNRLRLARYHALYRYQGFSDTMLHRIVATYPDMNGAEHETVLGQIALQAVSRNPDGALRNLVADTQFWRRVLAGSATVLTKSVAAGLLERNYALASQIAALDKGRASLASRIAPMTAPLTPEERDWTAVINAEYQWQAFLFSQLVRRSSEDVSGEGSVGPLDRLATVLFFKPHASINRAYHYAALMTTMNAVPGDELINKVATLNKDLVNVLDFPRWDMIYDPLGKAVVAIAAQPPNAVARYIVRTDNLDGAVRLLRLQIEIYQKRIPLKDVDAFLVDMPVDLYQPYLRQPMNWDPDKKELWFEGIKPYGNGPLTPDLHVGVRL